MSVHDKSVVVDAPVHKVFEMWSNFEDFPQFMSHIKEVRMMESDKSHWKANIAGIDEEWDAKTTKMDQDKEIAWESISGVQNSGDIRFESVKGGTRINVHIEYEPPAGFVGKAVDAVYVGKDFDKDLQQDLNKFKETVES